MMGSRSIPTGLTVLILAAVGPLAFVACADPPKPAATPVAAKASAPPPVSSGPPAPVVEHADISGAAKSAYDRGYAAFQAGDLASAKAAFTDAAHADPRAPAPLYSLGTVLEHLGDISGAQQQYRAAVAVKPDDPTAIGAYAMSLANSGKLSEADTYLTNQQQKHPESAPITTFLSEVKSMENDTASAQQLAQDALRMNPDYKPAMVAIAHDHYRAHRPELAIYALGAVLDGNGDSNPPRDKDNADAHLIRALMEEETGLRVAAMEDYDAARKVRPDMVEALIHLGVMKLQAGNVQEATPLLESAVKFAPTSALAHLNLADAYRLGSRVADAKREFDKALSMDSSLGVAHYDMALLYLFSPNVPGTSQGDQIATAIRELETYRTMRTPRPGGDDVDELLARAQAKQADLKASAAAAAPPPAEAKPAPPPATSAAPAGSAPATAPAGSAPASAPAAAPSAKPAGH